MGPPLIKSRSQFFFFGGQGHPGRARGNPGESQGAPGSPGYPMVPLPWLSPGPPWPSLGAPGLQKKNWDLLSMRGGYLEMEEMALFPRLSSFLSSETRNYPHPQL